jgi:hypothetical protein
MAFYIVERKMSENIIYKYRQLPSFEETHLVMGGCIVVEREDAVFGPQASTMAPLGMFDDRFGAETTRLPVDDTRYER